MTESKETRALNAFAAMSRIPDDYVHTQALLFFFFNFIDCSQPPCYSAST